MTYAIIPLEFKRRICVKQSGEILTFMEVDFAPKMLFSGPIIAVVGDAEIAFYDWSANFLTSLELTVVAVEFSRAGDVMLLSTETNLFVCSVNIGKILASFSDLDNAPEDLPEAISVFA